MKYPAIWPQFFTATVYKWGNLLKKDECKDIIIDRLKFLVDNKRVEVNAFVIKSNHVHVIWQPLQHYSLIQIQATFMTHSAKCLKKRLLKEDPRSAEEHRVNKYDRTYQIWKREPLSIELFTEKVFIQKPPTGADMQCSK
jgi:REP element-mobilizing transposase RayT